MDLYYYKDRADNFGDDLNAWLWDDLLPGWRDALPHHQLVGVGTILNNRMPRGQPKVILGSGAGYGAVLDDQLKAECRFVTVRGPLTAKTLGLSPALVSVDPAALLPDLERFTGLGTAGRPIFIPHTRSVRRLDWAAVCDAAGVDYVSPRGESEAVIRRIASAPLVIAESMHAAIIADAFRTPWHGLNTSEWFNAEKWRDWAGAIGMSPQIHNLFRTVNLGKRAWRFYSKGAFDDRQPNGLLDAVVRRVEGPRATRMLKRLANLPGQLSEAHRLEQAKDRLRASLMGFAREF